jgi:hypothetical protein
MIVIVLFASLKNIIILYSRDTMFNSKNTESIIIYNVIYIYIYVPGYLLYINIIIQEVSLLI